MSIQRPYNIVDLNFISLYIADYDRAIAFYTEVFGQPDSSNPGRTQFGWRLGATWLTIFPGKHGSAPNTNPRNTEFAVQVSSIEEVDRLFRALVDAGAQAYMDPADTRMYDPMRFACVDDPFGTRIDVYCPIA